MLSRHRVSRQAIELIKRFEGYRQKAAQLPDGRWTIGYGHTLTAREGAEVSETDAEALLVYDLIAVQHTVNETTLAPCGQNQFDALCSFAFNVGLDNFRRSQVLKRLNAGAAVQAACAMELWRKADFEGERIVIDALVRRRAAEKALFLTPDDGQHVAAPSPLLRPVVDLDALDLVPLRRPVEVQASMTGERVTARRDDLTDADLTLAPDPTPDPMPAVAVAAEVVSGRLSTLFAEPEAAVEGGLDDLIATDLEPESSLEPTPGPLAEATPELEPAPQTATLEPLPEPETLSPRSDLDQELEIPQAPAARRFEGVSGSPASPDPEAAPSDFIPARKRPPPPRRELSLVWDLMLALFGLAFFGFGIFWGLNARVATAGGLVTPILVAWSAGLAGVGFAVVAVYRLLQRLGRAAEQD